MRQRRGETGFELAFVGQGTCTIDVSGGGADYHTAKAQVSITVIKAPRHRSRGIPMRVRAELFEVAKREARALHDRHPDDIQAVLTTEAAAVKDGAIVHESGERGEAYIYLVAIRGNFRKTCKKKAAVARYAFESLDSVRALDGCGSSYPVVEFAVLASDDEVEGRNSVDSYPDLKSLGEPVRLVKA